MKHPFMKSLAWARIKIGIAAVAELVILGGGAVSIAQVATEKPAASEPKLDLPFVISFWGGPPMKETTAERYKEIADCGFNIAMPPADGSDLKTNLKILDACKAVRLKAIVHDNRLALSAKSPQLEKAMDSIVADYAAHPALAGYFVTDEPSATLFPVLGTISQYLLKRDPKRLPFINLFPNYASAGQLGTATYEEHVSQYIATVKPKLVSWDHYKQMAGDESLYFKNLEIVRSQCRTAKLPFIQIILSLPHWGYRNPTEADLRWQVYTSLAYGARGIVYFTYWTLPSWGLGNGPAIIGPDGKRDAKYEIIRRLNGRLHALAPTLMQLQSAGVYSAVPLPPGTEALAAEAPVKKMEGGAMVLGWLKDEAGGDYLFVVNRSFKDKIKAQLTLAAAVKQVEEISQETGKPQAAAFAAGVLSADLEAGEGRLFRLAMAEARAGEEARDIAIWPQDSMVKVFRDATPPKDPGPAIEVEAARNEVISGQAVFWCARDAKGLKVRASELALEGGRGTIPAPRVRLVGYVLVKDGKQPGYQLRNRPAHYPDPLIEEESMDVPARTAQPVWLTLKVPKDAAPGVYIGRIEAEASVAGAAVKAGLTVKVRVCPATLPDERTLQVTNWSWLHMPWGAKAFGVEKLWSAEHWALLRNAAMNMAAHRQNVIRVDPLDLAEFMPGADGGLRADFSRLDQFLQIFVDEGVAGRIEGADLATRKPGAPGQDIFRNPFVVRIKAIEAGKVVERLAPPESPEAQKFCAWYLPALIAHLREKKWLDRYMQHLADEVMNPQLPTYRAVAALVRKHAPGVKTVEAIFEPKEALVGIVDVWVPKTSFWEPGFFGARQKAGEEVWLYTCWDPNGRGDLNRFIEYPLTRTRLLHWLNYATGTSGYLHWGWDYLERYRPEAVTFNWTPGDEWLIYPGKGAVLDSIRSEAMLEGIQDYELLTVLARQDRAAADRICRILVKSRGEFQDGAAELRSARSELLKAIKP